MGNSNQTAFETACKESDLQTVKQFIDQPVKWYEPKLDLFDPLVSAYIGNRTEIFLCLSREITKRGEYHPLHLYMACKLEKKYRTLIYASEK